jgi:hypothetical protein
MENKIRVYHNFLSDIEVDILYNFSLNNDDLYKSTTIEPDGFWKNRTLHFFNNRFPIPSDVNFAAQNLLNRIKPLIENTIGDGREVWADTINYAKWWDGYEQHPHADGENPDGSEHPFPWRKFGCVFYLNDDYDGGEIWFPNFNIEMKPKRNMLAFFPGDVDHLHGVRNVTNGVRHTISSFWTYDINKRIQIYDGR